MPKTSIQYEEPIYCDPAFPVIFHGDRMDESRRFIYTNWHTGIELLYCTRGRARLSAGMRHESFGEGDMALVPSGELHTIYADTPQCDYYCLIVEPKFLADMGVPLSGVTFESVSRDEAIDRAFEEIVNEFQAGDGAYKPAVLGCILRLFARLCRAHAEETPQGGMATSRQQAAVQRALTLIRERLREPFSLDDVCRQVGLSKYYFCRLFRAYTELSPLKYVNMLRCDYARRLMVEKGFNVSEAARAVGVENMSYFARMYRQFMGALPSDAVAPGARRDRRGEVYGILGLQRDAPFIAGEENTEGN